MTDQSTFLAGTVALTFAVGLLAGRILFRGRAAPTPSAAEGNSPVAVPPACPGPPAVKPAAPLEMHLVLNVLNRMAMALSRDERAQDGMTWLSDYMASAIQFQGTKGSCRDAIASPVRTYWDLSNWLSGRASCELVIRILGEELNIHQASAAASRMQSLIRQLEGLPVTSLKLDCVIDLPAERSTASQVASGARVLRIDARSELPVDSGKAAPRGWSSNDSGGLTLIESIVL